MVGSTYAYTLMLKGIARELVLINRNADKAEGEAMDISHCQPYTNVVDIRSGGYELCDGADLVVITAGSNQEKGQDRLDLAGTNAEITAGIVHEVMRHADNPLLMVVSNPVDVMTYVALKESGLPPARVFGSGTILDSARFRSLLGQRCGVDARSVHGHIIGEHGETELAAWSQVNMSGIPLSEFCKECDNFCKEEARRDLVDTVRNAAFEVIERKDATYYGIAAASARLTSAILGDERSIHSVSSLLNGQYGISDVCLSLPSIMDRNGVARVLEGRLSEDEADGLRQSGDRLRQTLNDIGY